MLREDQDAEPHPGEATTLDRREGRRAIGRRHGTGDEVQGTMADLALAASGRGARIDAVSGAGRPALAAWLGR